VPSMSLPDSVVAAARVIEQDLVSGAHDLARRATQALAEAVADAPSDDAKELVDTLRLSAATLARLRPAMSAIGNATAEAFHRVERALVDGVTPRATAERVIADYLRELDSAFAETVRQVAAVVPADRMVATISFSRTVVDALTAALPARVAVAESRPVLEGRETARLLAEAGIEVIVLSDAVAPGFVRECGLVLIGADAVLADGAVVNKVGSYPMALAARAAAVPLYAACESLKICPLHTMPPEMHPGAELWEAPPAGVAVRNPYFEVVAAELVTGIVTERGVMAPHEAAHVAAAKRTALRTIGAS